MPQIGFRSNGNTPYVYMETGTDSLAMGLDSSDSNKFKVVSSASINVLPTGTTPNIGIDPAANGNITLAPNGSGSAVISYMTAGVVQSSSAGVLTSSNGTNGQILIGGGAAPTWANLTAGSGVTITNAANSITVAVTAGGTVVETITGNTGGARSPTAGNMNIITANATPVFAGAGSTETLDFNLTNLALGSAMASVTTGVQNVGLGSAVNNAITSAQECTAIGYNALTANTQGFQNTAVGNQSLLTLNNGNNATGFNTSIGSGAGFFLATGSYNSFLGTSAGNAYTTSESSNICINSHGTIGESNTLRIGLGTGSGNQQLNKAFVCGIAGVNVGSVATVVTESSDQLGTAVITAGSGISVTPGANTITLAVSPGAAVVSTITGNTGGAISPTAGNINLVTANSNIKFSGSGSTETLDFGLTSNIALGSALSSLAGGTDITAVGKTAANAVTTATLMTALGWQALQTTVSGSSNTAVGAACLETLNQPTTATGFNTAIGAGAGISLATGSDNTFLGYNAGSNYTTSESSNVMINNSGTIGESNVLRIGAATGTGALQLNKAFICGINGTNVGSVASVVSISGDQLGSTTITAGSGISVTGGANTITIANTASSGVTSLAGNSGGGLTGALSVVTANSNITFVGSGTTITQDFAATTNTVLGNSISSLSGGVHNVGLGSGALNALTSANSNTAIGYQACTAVTTNAGGGNTGVGALALNSVTTGGSNTAIGFGAGGGPTTGSNNIMIGAQATNYTGSESSNILVNSSGTAAESHACHIGSGTGTGTAQLNKTFIAGIQTITVTGTAVLVSSSDQLGIAVSSQRYKTDIKDMGTASSDIYKLRPVTFLWRQDSAPGLKDASQDRQFGLIAEEVAQVYPSIVVFDKAGDPQSIRYELLPAILLNEIQKLNKRITLLEAQQDASQAKLGI